MTVLRGQVAVVHPDGAAIQPAPSGTTVAAGAEIRTLAGAGALITFFAGIEIELGQDTVLVVEQASTDGGRVNISLKQVLGSTINHVTTAARSPAAHWRRSRGISWPCRGATGSPTARRLRWLGGPASSRRRSRRSPPPSNSSRAVPTHRSARRAPANRKLRRPAHEVHDPPRLHPVLSRAWWARGHSWIGLSTNVAPETVRTPERRWPPPRDCGSRGGGMLSRSVVVTVAT
jgi:hypothetical protein